MKPYRRYQVRAPYFYCVRCSAGSKGPDAEATGRAHMTASGHEVHVVFKAVATLKPGAEAVTAGA